MPLDVVVGIISALELQLESKTAENEPENDTMLTDGLRFLVGDETTFVNRAKGLALLGKSATLGNPTANLALGCFHLEKARTKSLAYFDAAMQWNNPKYFPIIFNKFREETLESEALICWNKFLKIIKKKSTDIIMRGELVVAYQHAIIEFYRIFLATSWSLHSACFNDDSLTIVNDFHAQIDSQAEHPQIRYEYVAILNENIAHSITINDSRKAQGLL